MNLFSHAGATLGYRIEGSGPPIVFLHNGGASSTIWRHQEAALAGRFRTIVVDLPGFGAAPRPAAPLDLRGHVALIAALADALDLRGCLVVGNCMGSAIAAAVAVARPELVGALVLCNPLTEATFSAGRIGPLHTMARWAPGPTRLARTVARRVVPTRSVARTTLRFQLGARGIARGIDRDEQLLAGYQRQDQLPALVDVLDGLDDYAALDQDATAVAVPICTIWGAQNRVLSPAAGRALDRRLRPVRAEVLEGCGHLPMLEDPDRVLEIISDIAAAHMPTPMANAITTES